MESCNVFLAFGTHPGTFFPIMSPANFPQPLTSFGAGVIVHLAFFALGPAESQRLRDLGVREGNAIHVLKNEDAIIVRIEASRIALRREVAMNVFATHSDV